MEDYKWTPVGENMPKNRSIVLGSNERGECTVLVYKHGCFFEELDRIYNIVWWCYFHQPPVERITYSFHGDVNI